jgi:hypothetical protein
MGEGEEEGRRRASVLRQAFREGLAVLSMSLPKHVRQQIEGYLRCGDVRHGFMEVSCEGCPESRIVAFSCKGRGWCPSCTNRRALETGIHVEALLPRVAHRQWTLSLPYSVRFGVV